MSYPDGSVGAGIPSNNFPGLYTGASSSGLPSSATHPADTFASASTSSHHNSSSVPSIKSSRPEQENTSHLLIASVVQRLVKRLPHNTGKSLNTVEGDYLTRSCVANLISHSRYQLTIIVKEFLSVFESLGKTAQTLSDDRLTLELMQSQLFLLQVLVSCLFYSWRCSIPDQESPAHLSQKWSDPPPLEDGIARLLLTLLLNFVRQTNSREDTVLIQAIDPRSAGTDRNRGKEDDADSSVDGSSLIALALMHGSNLFTLHPKFPPERPMFEITKTKTKAPPRFQSDSLQTIVSPVLISDSDVSESTRTLTQGLYRQASLGIFYLSSSNWPVINARIRNRIPYLCTTNEEIPDASDLRLLECANINRARLGSTIKEFSSTFLHMKRFAQYNVALMLRRSIWTWIQYHPTEYLQLYASGRRLDGAPDQLFEKVMSLAESTKKKILLWPLLTSLLLVCPDLVSKAALGDLRKSGSQNRKGLFLDTLRKSLKNAKLGEVASLCCLDICKAASATGNTDSGLQLLAHELKSELQEKLFETRKTIYSSSSVDVPLMVEAFVAFFRLEPQQSIRDLIPVLMSESNSISFKIALVKACIQLASERDRLPWTPNVSLLYPHICMALRDTFKQLVARTYREDTNSLPRRPKARSEDVSGRNELITSVLQLWKIDNRFASYGIILGQPTSYATIAGGLAGRNDAKTIQTAIGQDTTLSLSFFMGLAVRAPGLWHLNQRAGSLIGVALDVGSDESLFSREIVECSTTMTSDFCMHFARSLSNSNTPQEQRHWLSLLEGSFKRKTPSMMNDLTSGRSNNGNSYIPSRDEILLEGEEVEKALLLTICSIDTNVCSQALRACGELAKFRRRASGIFSYSVEWIKVYEDLGRLDSFQAGRIAQQKRILACLRDAPSCSSASYQAWLEAYSRWSTLTLVVAKPLTEDNNEHAPEKAAQWHNFSGFLAALGGACAVDQPPLNLPSQYEGDEASKRVPEYNVNTFVQELVDLLVSDSIWVREKVKETLGTDISPSLNGVLLRMIHAVISDFFFKDTGLPRVTEFYTVFVEQSIMVMQMVLARMTQASEATMQVDIGALMVLYAEYLNSSEISSREMVVRVRTLLCQLIEALMEKRAWFTFSSESRVRNRLFQVLVGWTTESIEGGKMTDKMDRLQRDLDVACLHTISILLDKLPLLLPEDTPLFDEKVEIAKSRQFSTYFNYFIKVLNRARIIEENPNLTSSAGVSVSSSVRTRESNMKDMSPLKHSAIVALSNLLASNIENGLHHSLPLAYQDDVVLRTAFMQIMTNVLNQGTAFDRLESLGSAQKQNRLIDLVCESDLQLALTICNICKGYDDGGIDFILLNIFDSRGGIVRFLKAALYEEIEKTPSEELIFRSNSFRTHLLSTFGRTHGYEYLRSIMLPLIEGMVKRDYKYEIDTQKLDDGINVSTNQSRLEDIAQAFIDEICSSAHRVPAVLRELCRHIRQLMDRRFPSSRYQGVGGFIFLRFINPAVVAPQIIDIQGVMANKDVRRGLLLVSKILQTLASNTLFPSHKEPFMTSLNDFLKRNVWKITTFLDQVSDSRTDPERLSAANQPLGHGIHPFGYGIDDEDQGVLRKFCFENIDKIGKELLSRSGYTVIELASNSPSGNSLNSSRDEYVQADCKRIYEQLCLILAEMGDVKSDEMDSLPSENHKPTSQDLMRKYQGKSVEGDTFKKMFREGASSKAGRAVFYFTAWVADVQTLDYESFLYYAITLLQNCGRPYDIVFDCTGAEPGNLTPPQWMNYFISMFPSDVSGNLRSMIGYNVNMACCLYVRPWTFQLSKAPRTTSSSTFVQNTTVQFCTSVHDLEKYIERRNIGLDPATLAIGTANEERRFENISMVWYYRSTTPVVFKLSENHLQVTSKKSVMIFPPNSGFTNEVFHLADIDDVRSISIRGDDNTFLITFRGGSASFVFVSRNRSEIVQALRQARARVSRYVSSGNKASLERTLLPNDVPGTLLNMAMLNILSQNANLRLSAYNLLCALSSSFNFGASNARKRLLDAKGLALSCSTVHLVSDLSKDFAVAAPGVTLEFLSSFFEGFERTLADQKIMCLEYMSPWLANLPMFMHTSRDQQPEYQRRIKEILSHLIAITVQEPNMYGVMQRSVWRHFSKLDDVFPNVLDVFAEAAMDSGLHTERFERVLDTMVSFSSINLRGKLLAKLRRAIAKTAQNPAVSQLHENLAWKEIVTLLRMNLSLSFSSHQDTLLYLPELLHSILLLAGTGETAARYIVHGTTVNLVHALCTADNLRMSNGPSSSKENSETDIEAVGSESLQKLRTLLKKLSTDEFLNLFGLPEGMGDSISSAPSETSLFAVRESPNNQSISVLATALYEVVSIAAPTIDTANAWRARLTSLVTSKAFQYNPIIQSRAFILLGCLADVTGGMLEESHGQDMSLSSDTTMFEVDDDLLYQILVSLRGSIQEWASVANDSPIISIVSCLSKVVKILPDQSRYLPQMFWLGISIIQYGHIPLFKSGVELVDATVKTICTRGLPSLHQMDLISYLLDGRFEFREAACRLDDETGVDFEINFGFGVAALLVKGLRHPSTREVTIDFLQTMLQNTAIGVDGQLISAEGKVSTEQLGFFISLLPTATKADDFKKLLCLAGIPQEIAARAAQQHMQSHHLPSEEEKGLYGIYSLLQPLENKIALLVITLLSSLLQQASVSDSEKQLLYGFLADSSRQFPAIVSILYDLLLPSMHEAYLNSQNEEIVRSVDAIAQIAISEPIFQLQVAETKKRGGAEAYLVESGYACLLDCGTFSPPKNARRVALAKLSATLLSGLIDAGTV